jgi:putative nucleotidyltransferase with HDIG domain
LGVVYVDTRGATSAFTQNDLEMLVALSGPAAVAIKNAQYVTKLEKSYKDTLLTIANTVEMRDHYTVGHTWRVTRFALEIARELGWDQEQLNVCERGGLLHDVGKIAIDDAILRKPSGLTQDEYEKMKIHPERGARLLRDSEFLVPLVPYALYHHERFDGKGYPFGLAGENIPIEGRIIAVADTFDAMTSNRPYRKGLDPAIAVAEIEKGKTTQFDPACVDAFIAAYKKGRIDPILQEYNKGEKSVVCPFCSTYVRIPEGCKESDRIECGVCHRKLRLHFKNDTWFADLVPATETVVRAGQAASK